MLHTEPYIALWAIFTILCNIACMTRRKVISQIYAPQTKILEGLTKEEIHIFRYTFQWFVAQRVLTPLKNASKILISSFVNPSKIFVGRDKIRVPIRRG
jgi:hypothetical protein